MVYKELKGKTFNERQSECPPEYWCYQPLKDGVPDKSIVAEVWADPHAMYCPACKTNAVDTGPDASFLCLNCGLQFRLGLDAQAIYGRRVYPMQLNLCILYEIRRRQPISKKLILTLLTAQFRPRYVIGFFRNLFMKNHIITDVAITVMNL